VVLIIILQHHITQKIEPFYTQCSIAMPINVCGAQRKEGIFSRIVLSLSPSPSLSASVYMCLCCFPKAKNAASLLKIVSHTGDSCVRQHYYYYYCYYCSLYFQCRVTFRARTHQLKSDSWPPVI